MSYLLDTDTASAHLRHPTRLFHRFTQYSGRLYLPAVGLAELFTWAYGHARPPVLLASINDLLQDVEVLVFDSDCAETFGRLKPFLRRRGITVAAIDLMIASVALVHDLTLVTHNTAGFAAIPGLGLEDWLSP
jgi:tRNA(fMet)-specific endonuclease VapC